MSKSNAVPIDFLKKGDSFEFVGLEHCYRNLVVANINDCGVLIRGEIGDENEFKPLSRGYTVSCNSLVRRVKKS